MSNKTMVFNEKTVGRHTKRLQKELSKINHELKLSEAQNMLSRILGMNDYHELKQVLKFDNKDIVPKIQSNFPILKITNNQYESMMIAHYGISLINAEKNFERYCKFGEIDNIKKYLQSEDIEIQNYIQINSHYFFKIAASENQLYVCKMLSQLPYCKLEDMSDAEIIHILQWTNKNEYEDDVFNYIFYELKLPLKMDYKEVNLLLELLISSNNLSSIKKYINDKRTTHLIDINWSTPSGTFWSIVRNKKYCVELYDYFVNSFDLLLNKDNLSALFINNNPRFFAKVIINKNFNALKEVLFEALCNKETQDPVTPELTTPKISMHQFLDDNLLSLAIKRKENDYDTLKFFINNMHISPSMHDYLVIQNACYYCDLEALHYLLGFQDCENYLKNNAQKIFDYLSNSLLNNEYLISQYHMCKFLFNKYALKINHISFKSNNSKLILFLQEHNI